MQEWVEKVTGPDGGQRLDAFWQSCLDDEGVARNRIQSWIRDGRAWVNGVVCLKPSTRIVPGQMLRLAPEFQDSELCASPGHLDIVHADADLVVVNKAAGMTVHPAPSVQGTTLVHRVAHYFPELLTQPGERPGVVHRLDKDTTGLIVLALTESAKLNLSRDFGSQGVYKEYLALVAGIPKRKGVITLPLGRHPHIKTRMAVVERGGRPAESWYRLLWSAPDKSASLLRVRILTGRTHQIRVHMAAIGHPLLGDRVYADPITAWLAPRQMLHAWHMRFVHPHTGENMTFCCPPPQDFLDVLTQLSRGRLCVGLTGVSGSGKSTVRRVAEAEGIPVFCADQIVAEAYAKDGVGCSMFEHHFGLRFSAPEGGIDRHVLREAMAESESLRREVERLVHPLVRHALQEFLRQHGKEPSLAEIPLLCEAGLAPELDLVAVVFCPDGIRRDRLRERGWSQEQTALIDSWQWPQAAKVRMAHLVLDNSGTLDELERRSKGLVRVLREISRRRSERSMGALQHFFDHPDTFDHPS